MDRGRDGDTHAADPSLPVFRRPRSTGTEFEGRWHDIYIEIAPGAPVSGQVSETDVLHCPQKKLPSVRELLQRHCLDDPPEALRELLAKARPVERIHTTPE